MKGVPVNAAEVIQFIEEHHVELRYDIFNRRFEAVWPHRAVATGSSVIEAVASLAKCVAEYEAAHEAMIAAVAALDACQPAGHLNPEFTRLFHAKFAAQREFNLVATRLGKGLRDRGGESWV
jgi:hypothetical protein